MEGVDESKCTDYATEPEIPPVPVTNDAGRETVNCVEEKGHGLSEEEIKALRNGMGQGMYLIKAQGKIVEAELSHVSGNRCCFVCQGDTSLASVEINDIIKKL